MNKLEIACNNIASCLNAQRGGAHRIELFENLSEGGCTPSHGTIKAAKELVNLPLYVMIRPRGGDFCYSEAELKVMLHDIAMCKDLDVAGIVLGLLNEQRTIEERQCERMMEAWGKPTITFHRAIDCTSDIMQAAATVARLGFERILTSGGAPNAWEGRHTIKSLQENFGGQIKIMAGAGVTLHNAIELIHYCGIGELHSTCKKQIGQSDSTFADMNSYVVSEETCVAALAKAIS